MAWWGVWTGAAATIKDRGGRTSGRQGAVGVDYPAPAQQTVKPAPTPLTRHDGANSMCGGYHARGVRARNNKSVDATTTIAITVYFTGMSGLTVTSCLSIKALR